MTQCPEMLMAPGIQKADALPIRSGWNRQDGGTIVGENNALEYSKKVRTA